MDDKTAAILTSWGYGDLIATFTDHGIDYEALLLITPDILKELIPKIGERVKFAQKLKELKVENANSPTSDNLEVRAATPPNVVEDTRSEGLNPRTSLLSMNQSRLSGFEVMFREYQDRLSTQEECIAVVIHYVLLNEGMLSECPLDLSSFERPPGTVTGAYYRTRSGADLILTFKRDISNGTSRLKVTVEAEHVNSTLHYNFFIPVDYIEDIADAEDYQHYDGLARDFANVSMYYRDFDGLYNLIHEKIVRRIRQFQQEVESA